MSLHSTDADNHELEAIPEHAPDTVSRDTVKCLQALLRHARRGDVIGIAFGAALDDQLAEGVGQVLPLLHRPSTRGWVCA